MLIFFVYVRFFGSGLTVGSGCGVVSEIYMCMLGGVLVGCVCVVVPNIV